MLKRLGTGVLQDIPCSEPEAGVAIAGVSVVGDSVGVEVAAPSSVAGVAVSPAVGVADGVSVSGVGEAEAASVSVWIAEGVSDAVGAVTAEFSVGAGAADMVAHPLRSIRIRMMTRTMTTINLNRS
jgi:hypothetical protein